MAYLNLRSASHVVFAASTLMLIANMVALAHANSLVNSVNPVSSTNFTDQLPAGYFAVPATDERGNVHEMIISTISLDSWFTTTTATCEGTPNPDPSCGWNPNALYDPTGVMTNGTFCSIGVKFDPNQYTECYSIMPNYSITLGANTAQDPELQLHANVGLLINSTWDGSKQSGMLGLAATLQSSPTTHGNSILDDMSDRYSQPKQFTLALSRSGASGGWLTFGSTLPPNALPLDNALVFRTLMQNSVINGRVNNVYAVAASVAILNAPSTSTQYAIDSGDVYLRVPPDTAQVINSAWNPPGVLMNDGSGRWALPCDAHAPTIGITINNHFFNFDKADMLWNQNNKCWSTIITSQNGPYALGQPLLKNVIVTFDLDNQMMYFQQASGAAPAVPAISVTNIGGTSTSTIFEGTSLVYETTLIPVTTNPSSTSVSRAGPVSSSTTSTSYTGPWIVPDPSQSAQISAGVSALSGVSTFVTTRTSFVTVLSTSPVA